jgi:hypothetical protein
MPVTGSNYNEVVMNTRPRPKIGTDGRPATTGEMIYPQTARKVTRTDAPEGWEALRGTPEYLIEWMIPSDSGDFLGPRRPPVIYLKPFVMKDGRGRRSPGRLGVLNRGHVSSLRGQQIAPQAARLHPSAARPRPRVITRSVGRRVPVEGPGGTTVDLYLPPIAVCSYDFFKHFDLGLLRNSEGSLQFDIWGPKARAWHRLRDFNPFIESMSPILIGRAEELADGGDLYAPNVEPASA